MLKKSILIIIFLFISCDTNTRFLGYNYEAEAVSERATISGAVHDAFTGELIQGDVYMDVNGQQFTIRDGDIDVEYIIGADELLDRPVPVELSSAVYFGWDTSMVVYPDSNSFSTSLTWAAPIVEASFGLREIGSEVTATIFDYQGVDDIDSVIWNGLYFFDYGNEVTIGRWPVPMTRSHVIDDFRALYRVTIPDPPDAVALEDDTYELRVVDKSGFVEIETIWWQFGDTLR